MAEHCKCPTCVRVRPCAGAAVRTRRRKRLCLQLGALPAHYNYNASPRSVGAAHAGSHRCRDHCRNHDLLEARCEMAKSLSPVITEFPFLACQAWVPGVWCLTFQRAEPAVRTPYHGSIHIHDRAIYYGRTRPSPQRDQKRAVCLTGVRGVTTQRRLKCQQWTIIACRRSEV